MAATINNLDYISDTKSLSEWKAQKLKTWVCSATIDGVTMDVSTISVKTRVHALIMFKKYWDVLGVKIFNVRRFRAIKKNKNSNSYFG